MAKIAIPVYQEVEISQAQFKFILSIANQLSRLYVIRDHYREMAERPGAVENVQHKDIGYKIPYTLLLEQVQQQVDHYEGVLFKSAKLKIRED